jgi:hypothetical protein
MQIFTVLDNINFEYAYTWSVGHMNAYIHKNERLKSNTTPVTSYSSDPNKVVPYRIYHTKHSNFQNIKKIKKPDLYAV